MEPNRQKNLRVVGALVVAMSVMIGLVAYSPTLYRLFCAATGYGGTTQRADSAAASVSDKTVTVRFDTNIASDLPWRFEPVQRDVKVRLGEDKLVFFRAENLSDKALVGHATFNVTPDKVGLYFKKIQCFCFDDERLEPHQQVDMPVDFFVDPALAQDPDTQDVSEITLSYTFFRTADSEKAKDLSRFLVSAPPDPHRGEELFEQRCTACHALDRNKAGPALGGVFGRRAGSVPGYNYSPALLASGVEWDQDDLDRWLADPRGFVAGARMPIKIPDATTRRDIIAYLKRESIEETAPLQHSASDAVPQHASLRAPK
ncbi:MAG: cytochrome c oxidase assembly protein [Rhodospirillales bacterium]|nr:cytochrome c oxidase assembly protein [Rhodospirillales bacterium]